MNFNFRNLLMPLLAGAAVISCDQKELDEVTPSASITAESSSNIISSNFIFNEGFESSSVWPGLHEQFGTSHAFNVSSTKVLDGSKAGRFELRESDPHQSGGTRAEVLFPEQSSLNLWYAFSVYFPKADYAYDSYTEIINQWHQGGGASPAIALEVMADRYRLVIPSGASGTGTTERIDLGPVSKDTWNRFAFRIKHSSSSDGLIEVYLNGNKIHSRSGSNMYPLSSYSPPRWKVGIYKWKWNDSRTTDTDRRVLYFDNVRIGSGSASLTEMLGVSTTTATTTTEPALSTTTQPTTSTTTASGTSTGMTFTLVDASADKDVVEFGNGATLNLGALGVRKFNVRANTPQTGSVHFELSGQQSRSYTDSSYPYAVQGDNGSGNYYYGGWAMPTAAGTYTLKVTPYSGSNASGTAGATSTITFTVTNSGETVVGTSGSTNTTTTTTAPAPSTSTTPTTTTTTTTSGTSTSTGMTFTLVDGSADKDVMSFGDGAVMDLTSMGVRKFNVRANTPQTGSVHFELSGQQSRSYTDSKFPYSVQGDSGTGNYYFGDWELPTAAGTYTLKVTPYSGSNGSGTAGQTTTITFTVK